MGDREGGWDCRVGAHARLSLACGLWMESPLDAIIHALKYEERVDLGPALARLAASRMDAPAADLMVPVPLAPGRRRDRGYNQAEVLAREWSSLWSIPMHPGLLVRRRATRAQARLAGAARRRNVSGAFAMARGMQVRGARCVLVDDVATTGATLLAAAQPLLEAGATRIHCVSVALA